MPRFVFLVVAWDNGRRGEVVDWKKKGEDVWGIQECPPKFNQVVVDCKQREARFFCEECVWDFEQQAFRIAETGELYESEAKDIVDAEVSEYAADGKQRDETLAVVLNDDEAPPIAACNWLRKSGLEEDKERRYWVRRFYPGRKAEGAKNFLKAVRAGWYSDVRSSFQAMPAATQSHILQMLDDDDREYIEFLCKYREK